MQLRAPLVLLTIVTKRDEAVGYSPAAPLVAKGDGLEPRIDADVLAARGRKHGSAQ